MSPKQMADKDRLKERNRKEKKTRFIRVLSPAENSNPLLPTEEELTGFPSEFSALRRDEHDNLGYRIPRLVAGPGGDNVPLPELRGRKPKKEKTAGRNQKIPAPYTKIQLGLPDLDAGVDGWIQPQNTQEFVVRGNRVDSLLEAFHRMSDQIIFRKDQNGEPILDSRGKKIEERRIQHVKAFRAETSALETKMRPDGTKRTELVKASASTVSYRDTIGISPGLSRTLQRMVEDGLNIEARRALEMILEPLGRYYESTYRGPETHAKVNSTVWHLDSEHAHVNLWPNTTYLTEARTGVNQKVVPVRRWDARASCHYGPGPGVMFWMRHFAALGDLDELATTEPEGAKNAGYTKMLCDQALESCRLRAETSYAEALAKKAETEARGENYSLWIKPPDDFARDLRLTQELDRLLSQAIRDLGLEKDFVAIGMAEYREHLVEAYREGNAGIRRVTPEDLEQIAKMVEFSLTRPNPAQGLAINTPSVTAARNIEAMSRAY